MKWLPPYMFANVGFLAVMGVLAVTMAGCSAKIEGNSSMPLQNASSINVPSKDISSADSKQSCENVYTYELGKELNIVIQDSTQKWTIHKIDQKNDRLELFFTLENVDSVDSLIDLDINYAVAFSDEGYRSYMLPFVVEDDGNFQSTDQPSEEMNWDLSPHESVEMVCLQNEEWVDADYQSVEGIEADYIELWFDGGQNIVTLLHETN